MGVLFISSWYKKLFILAQSNFLLCLNILFFKVIKPKPPKVLSLFIKHNTWIESKRGRHLNQLYTANVQNIYFPKTPCTITPQGWWHYTRAQTHINLDPNIPKCRWGVTYPIEKVLITKRSLVPLLCPASVLWWGTCYELYKSLYCNATWQSGFKSFCLRVRSIPVETWSLLTTPWNLKGFVHSMHTQGCIMQTQVTLSRHVLIIEVTLFYWGRSEKLNSDCV